MAPIKLKHIVSCSSQDPAHPADNLLKSGTNHRWKCKAGESSASVVIQLEKSSRISGIDIGNESSAFIEVLGGSESVPDDFKVILVMSSFMTPMDARNEEQTNRVRIFRQDQLHQPECTEKWDRIKVVCSQPFNKFLKYGLAFITLHEHEPAAEAPAPSALGRFTLKNDDEDISVGSIFARRKEQPTDVQPPSAAGSWRDAVKASSSKTDSDKKKAPKKIATPKAKPSNDVNASTSKGTSEKEKPKKTPSKKGPDESKKEQKAASPPPRSPALKRPNPDPAPSSRENKQIKLNPNITYKPFNKLLENVEFAISGYINPGRADIRTKATDMGAKYRPDWTPTCTHLICAFANTPKFQQVKGKGKIVVRDWIDDCHRERKQLPWRRYAVDKADQAGSSTSTEQEVWELVENKNETNAAARRNAVSGLETSIGNRADDSGSDTEDEIERIVQQKKKELAKANDTANSSTTNQKDKSKKDAKTKVKTEEARENSEDAIFNISTEDESDDSSKNDKPKQNGLPELPSIFKNKFFYIHPSLSKSQIERVERYIVAFCGTLCEILDDNVHFVIAEKKDGSEDDAPGVFYVKPDWIWECNDAGRIVPFRNHEL